MKGFTLIELLVTIGIFVFMSGLLLSRYSAFNQTTLLANLAYDVALTIHQAQSYGVSVKTSTDAADQFGSAYGVNFQTASPSTFTFYSDGSAGSANAPNGVYTANLQGDALISVYNMKKGAHISALCAGSGPGSANCPSGLNQLDISFKRPDPQAVIKANGAPGPSYNYAQITIQSGDNTNSLNVVVWQNGQITVKN
jgi:prepilin-type N-terminal cleavage/methylation domain-containing protein